MNSNHTENLWITDSCIVLYDDHNHSWSLWKHHSTETVILSVHNDLVRAVDDEKHTTSLPHLIL